MKSMCISIKCGIITVTRKKTMENKQKTQQRQPKSPYHGIYTQSILFGFGSFAFMQAVYAISHNPAFSPENSINSAFLFALIAPIIMAMKITLRERRYKMYEQGIGDYRIKVPVSILINKGYVYVGSLDIYLVFATTRPHFISSVKMTNVVKVTFYDKNYVCLTLKNRREEERDLYTIKFRVEDNIEELMEVFVGLFEGRVENLL